MLPELEEELLVLEEKLEKAVDHLSAEYVTVRADAPIPRYSTTSSSIITDRPRPLNRWQT